MNTQQTAVEWLVEMLYSPVCKGFIEGRTQIPFHIIQQAKEMEKEQIINAHGRGTVEHSGFPSPMTSEEYYTKTYQQ